MCKIIKGYKVFNPDWTCRGFKYEVGRTYEEDTVPKVCKRGFHFCKKAADCFNYYNFDSSNKVAEVLALGEIDTDGIKSCTNKIQIVREVPWTELLEIVNTGRACTGIHNSGNYNSGNYNSGDYNKCCFSNGCFNTIEPKIYLFDKLSEWTYRDWMDSKARYLLSQINVETPEYVRFENMTDEERAAYPEAEVTGGYLKKGYFRTWLDLVAWAFER